MLQDLKYGLLSPRPPRRRRGAGGDVAGGGVRGRPSGARGGSSSLLPNVHVFRYSFKNFGIAREEMLMRSLRRLVFLFVILVATTSFGPLSKPAKAWALCHEGTTRWADLHCQLGVAADCSECWVI